MLSYFLAREGRSKVLLTGELARTLEEEEKEDQRVSTCIYEPRRVTLVRQEITDLIVMSQTFSLCQMWTC